MNKLYIRYGEIPPDEKSKIHNRCDNSVVGEEVGVSVFEYIESRGIVIPNNEKAKDDFFMLSKMYWKNHYLVTGDEVGVGSDGEPLINNIKILKLLHKKREMI